MGFLGGFGRLLQGKPVFDAPPPEQPQNVEPIPGQPTPTPGVPGVPQAPAGPKERPVAVIERVECRPNGSNMDVSVTIQNNSGSELMLDKLIFMGTSREIDTVLNPGQEREFTGVYNGPRPNHRNYNTAELQYHVGGDYFKALNTVEFNQESDGTYMISRFRLQLPIKDV
jgi:hypothetical protein